MPDYENALADGCELKADSNDSKTAEKDIYISLAVFMVLMLITIPLWVPVVCQGAEDLALDNDRENCASALARCERAFFSASSIFAKTRSPSSGRNAASQPNPAQLEVTGSSLGIVA